MNNELPRREASRGPADGAAGSIPAPRKTPGFIVFMLALNMFSAYCQEISP
jgi:hypothetical protein